MNDASAAELGPKQQFIATGKPPKEPKLDWKLADHGVREGSTEVITPLMDFFHEIHWEANGEEIIRRLDAAETLYDQQTVIYELFRDHFTLDEQQIENLYDRMEDLVVNKDREEALQSPIDLTSMFDSQNMAYLESATDWDLLFMVGLPRSGKSGIVREVVRREGVVQLASDDARSAVAGQTKHDRKVSELELFLGRCIGYASLGYMARLMRDQGRVGVKPFKFVIDGTNMDKRLLDLLVRNLGDGDAWKIGFVVVDTPPEVVEERINTYAPPDKKEEQLRVYNMRYELMQKGHPGWQYPTKNEFPDATFVTVKNYPVKLPGTNS